MLPADKTLELRASQRRSRLRGKRRARSLMVPVARTQRSRLAEPRPVLIARTATRAAERQEREATG